MLIYHEIYCYEYIFMKVYKKYPCSKIDIADSPEKFEFFQSSMIWLTSWGLLIYHQRDFIRSLFDIIASVNWVIIASGESLVSAQPQANTRTNTDLQ